MRMKKLLCCLLTAMLLTGSLAFADDTAAPAVEPTPTSNETQVPAQGTEQTPAPSTKSSAPAAAITPTSEETQAPAQSAEQTPAPSIKSSVPAAATTPTPEETQAPAQSAEQTPAPSTKSSAPAAATAPAPEETQVPAQGTEQTPAPSTKSSAPAAATTPTPEGTQAPAQGTEQTPAPSTKSPAPAAATTPTPDETQVPAQGTEQTPAPSAKSPAPTSVEAAAGTEEAEASRTAEPTGTPTSSPTDKVEAEKTPAPTASSTPTIMESAPPAPTPTVAPTAEPPQKTDFVPTQDAWTQFADQTYFEGSVEAVLREAQERGEHPVIYVRTHQQVTVTKVAQSYIECLTPDPDEFVDGENGSVYRVVYEVGEQTSEGIPPPVTLRVVDIHRQARKTDTPTPAVPNEETPAPPDMEETPPPSELPPASTGTEPSSIASPTPLPTITTAFPLPSETPGTDQPQEQAEIAEDVQAWTRYSTGALVQGTAQEVLDSVALDEAATGELPTVYIRARDMVRLENIAESFLQRLSLLPDADVFAREGEAVVRWKVEEGVARGLPPIDLWVETLPALSPETPVLTVSAQDYFPDEWSRVPPVFTLSGIEEGSADYVYGVFICDERLIILSRGTTEYTSTLEGEDVRLRFAILDMMGDVVCFSEEYAIMLDMTPPDGPYPMPYNDTNTIAQVYASDSLSGLEAISLDGGNTWLSAELSEDHFRCQGKKGETIPPERLRARDFAGNVSKCYEEYEFGPPRRTGGGTAPNPIHHVPQTLDYSLANYNALELSFSDESQTQLIAGDTVLNLSLTVDGRQGSFTAQTLTYPLEEGALPPAPNLLMLTAQERENAACAWQFSGDVYRLLYNSGVDFLVLRTGGYIAVLPTAGFTAGTEYVRLKSNGISTRRFVYTVTQDEAMLETAMMVEVEEQTYELGEAKSRPMYRTGVLIGPMSLLDRPYSSYVEQ